MRAVPRPFFLLPLVAALAAWLGAMGCGFVWDDTALVLRDPLVRSPWLALEGFRHFLFLDATASDFYRPLQRLSFQIDYLLWGRAAWGWHLTSVLWHAAAAGMLGLALERWLARHAAAETAAKAALLGAVAWAIHPVHHAAVVYVSGRADPMCAAFGFAALYVALRERSTRGRAWLVAGLAGCSMLSKEHGLLFAVAALAMAWSGQRTARLGRCLPILAVLAAYAVLRLSASHLPPPPATPEPPAARAVLVARALPEYAGLLVAPLRLHMERDLRTGIPRADYWLGVRRGYQTLAGVLLAVAWWLWLRRTRRRDPAAFGLGLTALLFYLPVSNLIPLNANAAEHWLYLPAAFLLPGAFLSFAGWAEKSPLRGAARVAAVAWLVALLVLAHATIPYWRTPETFLDQTIARSGGSVRMLQNRGNLRLAKGDFEGAEKDFRAAMAAGPHLYQPLSGLLMLQLKRGELDAARESLHRLRSMGAPAAQLALHEALVSARAGADPLPALRAAVAADPRDWGGQKRLAEALTEAGYPQDAAAALEALHETEAFRAESWQLLARARRAMGDPAGAEAALKGARLRDIRLDETR